MITQPRITLTDLYADDETAWLDAMTELIDAGAIDELDLGNLREFLSDMAKRDRREVESRLAVLLAHVLKWGHQPERRSRSWRATIVEQRQELQRLAGRGVLRNHAELVLGAAYREAVERAATETGLPADAFPTECGSTLDELLTFDLIPGDAESGESIDTDV